MESNGSEREMVAVLYREMVKKVVEKYEIPFM